MWHLVALVYSQSWTKDRIHHHIHTISYWAPLSQIWEIVHSLSDAQMTPFYDNKHLMWSLILGGKNYEFNLSLLSMMLAAVFAKTPLFRLKRFPSILKLLNFFFLNQEGFYLQSLMNLLFMSFFFLFSLLFWCNTLIDFGMLVIAFLKISPIW